MLRDIDEKIKRSYSSSSASGWAHMMRDGDEKIKRS
jgi:hypothetical protein